MRFKIIFICALFIFCYLLLPGQQVGVIDTEFGINGKTTTDFGRTEGVDFIKNLSSGKIFVVGNQSIVHPTSRIIFARYSSNGHLDTSFGDNGKKIINLNNSVANNVKFLENENFIIFGSNGDIAKYNNDGILDPSFGKNGIISTQSLLSTGTLSEGKIIICRYEPDCPCFSDCACAQLVRYNLDGSLDKSFGKDGISTVPKVIYKIETPNQIIVKEDGSILIAGVVLSEGISITKFLKNGTLDSNFGVNGQVIIPGAIAVSSMIESGSKITVGGNAPDGKGGSHFFLARIHSDGKIDNTFGDNGKVVTKNIHTQSLSKIMTLSNGDIMAIGSGGNSEAYGFTIAKYKTNGVLDNKFGNEGLILTYFKNELEGSGSYARTMAYQNGKLIVGGSVRWFENFPQTNIDFALARYLQDEPGKPQVLFKRITPAVCISSTGEVIAEASGANPPFVYKWSNGSNNQILINAVAGEYRLTVTNVIGVSNFATITIPRTVTKPSPPLLSNIQTQSATVSWTGDAETYQLQYKPSAQANWITATTTSASSATLINLSPNTRYDVRVIARCVDTDSEPSSISSFTTLSVPIVINRPPQVKIIDPTNNSTYKAPASLSIQVEASDPDGTIAKVEFYINDRFLGSDFDAPYARSITLSEGTYVLTAKAIDNLQAFTISSPVSITVSKAGHEFDEPCGKILALSSSCSLIEANNTGASPSAGINSTCPGSSTGKDIWFQFVAPPSGRVIIETRAGTLVDGVMALYLRKNSCTDLQQLSCQDDPDSGGLMPSLEANLTPGQTYLIRFWGYDGAEGSFQLCARDVVINQTPYVSILSPGNNASFNAPASFLFEADAYDPDGSISKVEFFLNGNIRDTDSQAPYSTTLGNLSAGTYTLTAKAYDNQGAVTTSNAHTITVINNTNPDDEPCGKVLSVSADLNYTDATNSRATFSSSVSTTGLCGASGVIKDVWFQFTASSTRPVVIQALAGTLSDGVMALYRKQGTCTQLQLIICNDDDGEGNMPKIQLNNPVIGQVYVIRFWGFNSTEGTFRLGIQQDDCFCVGFDPVCGSDGKNYASPCHAECAGVTWKWGNCSSANRLPEVSITAPANNVSYNAPASFSVTANATDPDGNISKVEFFLNGNLQGTDSQVPYSTTLGNLSAGTYTLTAKAYDNQGAVATSNAHTITVINNTNPDDEPCGKVLSVSADLNYTDVTNSRATFSSGVSTTELCQANGVMKDVWFQFTVSSTRPVVIQALAGTLSDGVMALYRKQGTCTQLQLVTCNDDDGEGNMPKIQLNNPVIGQVYVIRFWGYNSAEGTFRLGIQQDDFLCPTVVDPVCGSDGREYLNACYAERAGVSWRQGGCTTNNRNPEVSITAPTNNASYNAPASFSVITSATDPDGNISKVELLLNGTLHSTDNQFPYAFSVSNLAAGTYTLTAKAYDNQQASTVSSAVTIRVNGTTPPPPTTSNNNALVLNGVSDYKSVGSSMFDVIRSFTIETWARFNAPGSGNNDFIAEIGNSSYTKLWFWYNNDNTFGLPSRNIAIGFHDAQGGYNNGPDFLYSFTPQAGTWYHLAYTYDFVSKRITLYIDGVSQGSRTVSSGSPSISQSGMNLNIGRRIFGGVNNHFFNGQLDEFRVWDYARTASEIAQNFRTELSGSESGLICYYKFDDAVDSDCSSRRLNLQGSARTPQSSSVPNLRDVACGSRLTDIDLELSSKPAELISIYPNPTSALVKVDVQAIQGQTLPRKWIIMDEQGRVLRQIRRNPEISKGDNFEIDFSKFSNGKYLLSTWIDGKLMTYPVLVTK